MNNSALPKNWQVWPLADVGTWLGGGTPSKADNRYWRGHIPWVSPKDMKALSIVDTEDHISEEAVESSAAKIIPPGSVIFVTRSGILAHSFPVATTESELAVNQDLKAITPEPVIDTQYLAWCLRAHARLILDNCTKDGTTVQSIEVPSLKSYQVPIAPLNEQRRIVAKIEELFSELDKGVESLKIARDQLKVYRQAVLKHAFEGKLTAQWREKHKDKSESADHLIARINVEREARCQQELAEWKTAVKEWDAKDYKGKKPSKPTKPYEVNIMSSERLPKLPRGWVWVRYGDLCSVVRNGISTKPQGATGKKIFRISAVRPMEFDLGDVRYIDDSAHDFSDYYLKRGDLVFTRYNGSRPYVGVCAEYKSDGPHLYPDKLIRTTLDTPYVLSGYIEKAVNCGASRHFIEGMIRTTAGQSGVSGSDIKNIPIPLCDPHEQAIIRDLVDGELSRVSNFLADIEQGLNQSEALRQSILKKAFSGELVAQNPKDEPASVLLERIKAEKAEQNKDNKNNKRKDAA
jgi:type I restriction enzyme S subunit